MKSNTEKKYYEWLAGLIDGDGCFQVTKKGYSSLEISMELRDQNCLYQIQDKFGGSVKLKQGQNWLRYRLHHKKGLIMLIQAVNGFIRNPVRLLQLGKVCARYEITLKYPEPLSYDNAWLSGFIDSDGSIYLNTSSVQIFITASQKNKLLLDPLLEFFGGRIYTLAKVGAFKWTVYRKTEVLNLVKYFQEYPLKSKKMVRANLIPQVYQAMQSSAHTAPPESIKGQLWNRLMKKWSI